jgi:hypothetical protein
MRPADLSPAPCGHTPVTVVSGNGSGRVLVAGLACFKPVETQLSVLPRPRPPWPQGNLCAAGVGQLIAIIKNRLKSIQCRPALIGGFLAQAGLTLEPQPP